MTLLWSYTFVIHLVNQSEDFLTFLNDLEIDFKSNSILQIWFIRWEMSDPVVAR